MTNSKSTKRAFLSSVTALLLCFMMLLGTTFAWFTDSAATGRNVIQSGNLDVVLEYKTNWEDDWTEVTEDTKLFKDGALYEPGYTEVVFLRVSNAGSLALKYNLNVNVYEETTSTNVYEEEFSLKDYLEIGAYVQDEMSSGANYADILMPGMFGTREAALSNAKDFAKISEFDGFINQNGPLLPGDETAQVAALVLTMPTTVGNEANHKTDVDAPTIDLGVTLVATQLEHEEDSFGNDYDKDASLDDVKFEKKIVLSEDTTESVEVDASESVMLDMNDKTLFNTLVNNGTVAVSNGTISTPANATGADAVGFQNYGDATLTNVDMTTGSASDYGNILYAGSTTVYDNVNIVSKGGGIGVTGGAKATFNSASVHVDSTSTSGRYIFYVVGEGSELTINDGTFSWDPAKNQKRAYIYTGAGATVYVNGGTFGKASTRDGYTAGILGSGTVIIKGGTFGFDPSNWVADGYEAVKSGTTWTVSAK